MDISKNMLHLADGNQMPQQGFGVYKITDSQDFDQSITAAYENGYRLFDTAQMYDNEQYLGAILKKLGTNRDELFITTKVSEDNQGYDQTIKSVQESLNKLQMTYVDLLLIHWPIHSKFFDTWRALEDLKSQGLVKSIGVSNYNMIHLQYLATQAREMPVVNQVEVSPYFSQKPLLQFHKEHQIVTQAWSPLGRGKNLNDPDLIRIADKRNKSVAQIILRWHLQNGISFIPKSIHPERIKQNADIYDFKLTTEEMKQMDKVNKNHRISKEPELVYEFDEQYPY